jgi:hypothetical protein
MTDEVYYPDKQLVITDESLNKHIKELAQIQNNLTQKFIVSDLDRIEGIDEFMKIDIAHAVGVLEGKEKYRGINSSDKTFLYEIKENNKKRGGVAVVRHEDEVVDFYPIWESAID